MSIRPVDMKTALYIADDASKLRENQKSHEAGIAEQQATQNKHNQETKIETKKEKPKKILFLFIPIIIK